MNAFFFLRSSGLPGDIFEVCSHEGNLEVYGMNIQVGIRTYRPKFVQTIVEHMCPMHPYSNLRDDDQARQFVRSA